MDQIAEITRESEESVGLYFAQKGWRCTKLDKQSSYGGKKPDQINNPYLNF